MKTKTDNSKYPGIYQRGVNWEFRVTFIDPKTNEKIRKACSDNFTTPEKAFDAMQQAKAEIRVNGIPEFYRKRLADDNKNIINGSTSMEEFLNYWYQKEHRPTIQANTAIGDEVDIRVHMIPAIGHVKLYDLTSDDIYQMFKHMRALKKQGGKGLRYGTADHVRRVLSKALTWAKARGLVFENFAQYVQIDPDSEPFEQKPMSHEDISKFIFSLESEEVFGLAFKLSLVTGARPGEILGLKFSDFDFLNNTVCIRRQVCILIPAKETPDGKAIYGLKEKTKTDKRGKRYNKSLRIEPIPIALMEEVKRKRIKALENKLKHGTNYVDNDLVTCDEFGKFKIVRSFSGRYKRILKRAGLDEHRAYDMRHTFASIMQESNVPIITLANALGHSDTKMLEQHYAKNILGRHIVANAVNSMYNNTFVSK